MKCSDVSKLAPLARDLRRNTTTTESLLWFHLRGNRFVGIKFKRQQPIGNYIVDFVCLEKKIIIELDGGQHALDAEADRERDAWLQAQGFSVLRFWNNELLTNPAGVLDVIWQSAGKPLCEGVARK